MQNLPPGNKKEKDECMEAYIFLLRFKTIRLPLIGAMQSRKTGIRPFTLSAFQKKTVIRNWLDPKKINCLLSSIYKIKESGLDDKA